MILLAMTLFQLNLDPLVDSIAAVESTSGKRSANVYQISDSYLRDVNRIVGFERYKFFPGFNTYDKFARSKSRDMMYVYWAFYGDKYQAATGNAPTLEVLARIHNGGPTGYKKSSTERYWRRVKKQLALRGIEVE